MEEITGVAQVVASPPLSKPTLLEPLGLCLFVPDHPRPKGRREDRFQMLRASHEFPFATPDNAEKLVSPLEATDRALCPQSRSGDTEHRHELWSYLPGN